MNEEKYINALRQTRLELEFPGLFIDFYGTISKARFWDNVADAELRKALDQFLFDPSSEIQRRWMTGELSSREVHDLFFLGASADRDMTWAKFMSLSQRMKIWGLDLIGSLRKQFTVAIVTTNVDTFSSVTVVSKKLHHYVDAIVNSADTGVTKEGTDGRMFEIASKMTGTAISNSILIDDTLAHCRSFTRLGGRALCVRSIEESLDVLGLLNEATRDCAVQHVDEIWDRVSTHSAAQRIFN